MDKIIITVPAQPEEQQKRQDIAQAWAVQLVVVDADSRRKASAGVAGLKKMAAQVKDLFADSKKAAHAAHRAVCAAETKLLEPINAAARVAQDKILKYDRAERKRIEEERRRLQAEADAKAEAERKRLESLAARCTVDAEKREAYTEAAEAVIPQAVVLPQADDRAEGEVRQVRWRAMLTDIGLLIKAAAGGNVNAAAMLEFNQAAANRLATALKRDGIAPGVRFEGVETITHRAK